MFTHKMLTNAYYPMVTASTTAPTNREATYALVPWVSLCRVMGHHAMTLTSALLRHPVSMTVQTCLEVSSVCVVMASLLVMI